jgi:hypothetical protein
LHAELIAYRSREAHLGGQWIGLAIGIGQD